MKLKTIALSFLVLCLLALKAFAADVNLIWDATPDADVATGYKIYQATGANGTNWTLVATVPISQTSVTLSNLKAGWYHWRATAYTPDQESVPSNEVAFLVPLRPPGTLYPPTLKIASNVEPGVTPTIAKVEQSLTAEPDTWSPVGAWAVDYPAAFYRVVLQ
jgi:hypothetical protein